MIQQMIQETFNAGNSAITNTNYGNEGVVEKRPDAGELLDAPMKLRPVITNIGISLLVMAIFAVCFRI